MPIIECLETAEKNKSKQLVKNIAKAWYDATKTTRQILDLSRTKAAGG